MKTSNKNISKQKESAMAGSKTNFIATRIATYLILIIMTFLIFVPIFWMISTSIKSEAVMFDTPIELIPSNPTLEPFKNVWREQPFYLLLFLLLPDMEFLGSSLEGEVFTWPSCSQLNFSLRSCF